MRMGHGIRDDSEDTQICFVTTGYLVRLMAHHPEAFRHHTHLIIDEVHERSVDGDLLCLLARRLLVENTTLRLILMSATVHTVLYKDYFSKEYNYGGMDCLSVGVRRFPLDIKYADDLSSTKSGLPSMITSLAKKIADMTTKCGGKASDDVPLQLSKDQYNLAVSLIRSVGQVGSGILVFVSGIADITELTERFEGMSRYKLYAIHSDLPFEEQEAAFNPAGPDEVKVVIATNAAESSITLPDVDCVICLGTHKALRYHATTHRVQLVNTWISKASATQRAGRTGRVRPGKVYRLYSRELFEKFQEHEQSEVHRYAILLRILIYLPLLFIDLIEL
jgi:HrpA-like RNA helicase